MSLQQLFFSQHVPASLADTWAFFSAPANLQRITPADMDFRIRTADHAQDMYPGMIIAYTVRPLLGIPMQWVTEITHIKPMEYFIDDQRLGPYALWSHKHSFTEVDDGVLMQDTLNYQVPLGPVGDLLNHLFIRRKISAIFACRTQRVEEIFGP